MPFLLSGAHKHTRYCKIQKTNKQTTREEKKTKRKKKKERQGSVFFFFSSTAVRVFYMCAYACGRIVSPL